MNLEDKNNIPFSKSTTCLATRIPTNDQITEKIIEKIRACEDYIYANTNCKIVKVRDFEEISIYVKWMTLMKLMIRINLNEYLMN